MFELMVIYTAKEPQGRESFVSEVKAAGLDAIVRAEDGCICYEYYASMENQTQVILIERWESEEKQQIHVAQPHMTQLRQIKDKYIVDTKLLKFNTLD